MTTQSERTLGDLYDAIQGNSEEIDRAHGRLDKVEERLGGVEERLGGVEERLGGVEERLEGVESVLIAIATSVGAKVDHLPESKVIHLDSRRQQR